MNYARSSSCRNLALLLIAAFPVLAQDTADGPRIARPPIRIYRGARANATGPTGYTPAQMKTGYGFSRVGNEGAGQTIALIDAYDAPTIESDLATFSTQFSLPACTTANGCFTKVYATGTKPPSNADWATETSLDVEWSHAIAPQAKILLVEAAGQTDAELWQAVDAAVSHGATVLSMSFGLPEYNGETSADSHFETAGVTFVAAAGDRGNAAYYPAASPFVVGVGGTDLTLASSGAWQKETAWACANILACYINGGTGGGQSAYEKEPSYQSGVQTSGKRGIPDVAYDADPSTGVSLYDTGAGGWEQVGGTSMGSPEWAALFAIANSMRVAKGKKTLTQPQQYLYPDAETDYHDIRSGKNGTCGAVCTAKKGYDYLTGVGSPKANVLIPALVSAP